MGLYTISFAPPARIRADKSLNSYYVGKSSRFLIIIHVLCVNITSYDVNNAIESPSF